MVNVLAATIYKGISEIEVFWVLLALFGLIFSLFNFLEARKDVQALDRAKITNGRRLIATTARFQDGGRSLVHLIFLGIGLGSWTLTDMPLSDLPTNVLIITILIRWGLIFAAAILVVQSFASFRLRRNILAQEQYDLNSSEIRAKMEKSYIGKEDAALSLEGAADDLRSSIE
jgi:hypothetical protein